MIQQSQMFFSNRREQMFVNTLKIAPCYYVFIYFYSLLIEKDICNCWNVSVKLPCVCVCFSSGEQTKSSTRVKWDFWSTEAFINQNEMPVNTLSKWSCSDWVHQSHKRWWSWWQGRRGGESSDCLYGEQIMRIAGLENTAIGVKIGEWVVHNLRFNEFFTWNGFVIIFMKFLK